MPNSLRCKIKKWCYQGKITEKEYDRLIQGLNDTDKIKKIDDIKTEINERLWEDDAERVFEIIDKHMKEGDA